MSHSVLDTCVLIELVQSESPLLPRVHAIVDRLESTGQAACCIAEYSLAELWDVLTRPQIVNGYGYTAQEARRAIEALVDQFPILEMRHDQSPTWMDLASIYGLTGRDVRHARLAATMLAHGATHLIRIVDDELPGISGIRVVQVELMPA